MDGTSAYQAAWQLYINLLTWMRTHVILNIFGEDITFLGLLLWCAIVKIVIALIHAVLPGLGDPSDDDTPFEFPEGWSHFGDE